MYVPPGRAGLCCVFAVCLVACTGDLAAGRNGDGGNADASLDGNLDGSSSGDGGIVSRDGSVDGAVDGGSFDANGDSSNTCERVTVESEPGPAPEVMIVLDKSNSMNVQPRGAPKDLWGQASDAINNLTGQLDNAVAFGLATFPHFEPGMTFSQENACTRGGVREALELDNGSDIAAELSSAAVQGNTPTASTLNRIRNRLRSTPKLDPNAERIVVLVTDGAPNCGNPTGPTCTCTLPVCTPRGCTCDPLHCLDDDEAVAAITGLAADDVSVYVIGFAVSGWESVLDRMASAGGTGRTAHIPASDTSELQTALENVTVEALPCEYELSSSPSDLRYVKVVLDGTQLNPASASPTNGWTINGSTLELVGQACDTVRDVSMVHQVDITIECEEVPLI